MTAPAATKPATYQEALAVAAAIRAGRAGATADPVATVSTMSDRIASTRDTTAAWAKSAIRGLWATVNPYSEAQVRTFAEQAAVLMDSAQTAATRVAAAGQAQQLAAMGVAVTAAPSVPVDVRAPSATVKAGQLVLKRGASTVDYEGPGAAAKVSKADMTTEGIFSRPAAVFRYAKSVGAKDPAELALQRIDDLVDGNLMLAQRLAQQQVLVQAVTDLDTGKTRGKRGPKVIGYRRVIHPELSKTGTCGMCIAASDRIYHVGQLLPIHPPECRCTIAAVTEDFDPADDLNAVDLNQLYKDAGGTSNPHLKRTRYQVDEHGELGPVLVPSKAYKPRSQKSKRRAGGAGLQPNHDPVDVAKHQIGVLEENLAKMRADGVGEDSSKVAYHEKLIAKLRKQIADNAT